mmetsp:Transcript_7767/g.32404  ORF Transcript_7767/g.32404 Transcript_7767/m.32404 type:complete len:324 (+) Transcript_7767:56-1027(+)
MGVDAQLGPDRVGRTRRGSYKSKRQRVRRGEHDHRLVPSHSRGRRPFGGRGWRPSDHLSAVHFVPRRAQDRLGPDQKKGARKRRAHRARLRARLRSPGPGQDASRDGAQARAVPGDGQENVRALHRRDQPRELDRAWLFNLRKGHVVRRRVKSRTRVPAASQPVRGVVEHRARASARGEAGGRVPAHGGGAGRELRGAGRGLDRARPAEGARRRHTEYLPTRRRIGHEPRRRARKRRGRSPQRRAGEVTISDDITTAVRRRRVSDELRMARTRRRAVTRAFLFFSVCISLRYPSAHRASSSSSSSTTSASSRRMPIPCVSAAL